MPNMTEPTVAQVAQWLRVKASQGDCTLDYNECDYEPHNCRSCKYYGLQQADPRDQTPEGAQAGSEWIAALESHGYDLREIFAAVEVKRVSRRANGAKSYISLLIESIHAAAVALYRQANKEELNDAVRQVLS